MRPEEDRYLGLRDLSPAITLPQGDGRSGPQDVLPKTWRGDLGVQWAAELPRQLLAPKMELFYVECSPAAGTSATVQVSTVVPFEDGDLVRVGRVTRSAGSDANLGDVAVYSAHVNTAGTINRGRVLFAWIAGTGLTVFAGSTSLECLLPSHNWSDRDWQPLSLFNPTFNLVGGGPLGGVNDIIINAAAAAGGGVTVRVYLEILRVEEALRAYLDPLYLRRNP